MIAISKLWVLRMRGANKTPEEDIIRGLRSRNLKEVSIAIKQLYTDEWMALASRAVQSVSGKESDTEDVFQESLTAMIKNVQYGSFRQDSKLSTYFYEICRRQCMKSFSKYHTVEVNERIIDNTTPSLEKIWVEKEKQAEKKTLVEKLLTDLGQPCTNILKLRKKGYDFDEIAEAMGYGNPDSVRNQAARCRKKMRKLLQSDQTLYNRLKSLR